jgi:predicted SprT family Zn-dependent metalloprotease
MKALVVFDVSYEQIRLHVRLLAHAKDVYAELNNGAAWRSRAQLPRGAFIPAVRGRFAGTILIAVNDSRVIEIIAHEVLHAVVHAKQIITSQDDEPAAHAVGMLVHKILRRCSHEGFA